jgi:hypothetical protein
VNKATQEKLAFAGPQAIKWTYTVMPFGPVNGPAIFIIFIHDCQADWNELARLRGILVGDGTGTVRGCYAKWAKNKSPPISMKFGDILESTLTKM